MGEDGWIRVQWDNGSTNSYRMGKEGKYDLKLADPPPMTETDSDSESEVQSEAVRIPFTSKLSILKVFKIQWLRLLFGQSILYHTHP